MASTYLSKTLGTPTDNKKWTFSAWIKKGHIGGDINTLFGAGGSSSNFGAIWANYNNGQIQFYSQTSGGSTGGSLRLSNRLRDMSAWYHLVLVFDSANVTASERLKFYINGVQETDTSVGGDLTYPTQDVTSFINSNIEHIIGKDSYRNDSYYDGSMANVEFVDGQAYGPAYFGSTDSNTGIWTPQASSTISNYGTNGFKLKMDTTSPGADTSGKGNTFTVGAGTPTLTQGSPSNNYACMNPLKTQSGYSLTMDNGNLRVRQGQAGQNASIPCTMPVKKGKWYVEVQPVSGLSQSAVAFGIGQVGMGSTFLNGEVGGYPGSLGGVHYTNSGNIQWYASGDQSTSTGTTFTGGSVDKIGIALDCDNTKIYWYKNNVLVNSGGFDYSVCTASFTDPLAGGNLSIVGEYVVFMMAGTHNSGDDVVVNWNFGDGFFATTAAGTASDANGQGLFAYAPPTGYYALNTKNLEAYG